MLPALIGLGRVLQDQPSEARDGHETRILQVAVGKLHAELLLDLCNEFDYLHRREPSGFEVVGVADVFRRALADLPSRHEPVCKPLLHLCFQRFLTFRWPHSVPANRHIPST
jgi:hypothetical protein